VSAAPRTTSASTLEPSGLDPLRWAWQLLTNVKFALLLVGLAGIAGLIGTVLPQMPGPMRGNPAARSAWLELRRADYGPLTGLFDRLGFFEVFHTAWFNGLWFLIIVAVTVCTVSRLRPTIRAVRNPPNGPRESLTVTYQCSGAPTMGWLLVGLFGTFAVGVAWYVNRRAQWTP